ncbi:hypothetical protein [Streptomyces sp. LaPpAH-108]|uniref:hypothetical protein n=1 Tax=Streptomyces sp. LaPpAH-108 TaxID=1155714 RepID=UPI00036A5D40|nr:hypothetical protein [Streptomyces sp. LaPpAH-108]
MKPSSYALGIGTLLLTALASSGCSPNEAKQDFTVPASLCGVSVPSAALSRLLPADGTQVSVQQDGTWDKDSPLCNVTVDKRLVLVVSTEWVRAGDSARSVLGKRLAVWQQKSADGGAVVYSDRGAASVVKCQDAGVKKFDVGTFIKVLEPGRRDEQAMGQLIRGYTRSVTPQRLCRPTSG